MTYRLCQLCGKEVFWSEPFVSMEIWLGSDVTKKAGHYTCIKEEMNG